MSAVVTYKSNFCNAPAFYSHITKPISVHMHCPLWGLSHKAQYPPGRKRMYNVEQNFSTLASLIFGFGSFFAIRAIPVHCRMFNHILHLHLLEFRNTLPPCDNRKYPQTLSSVLLGAKCSPYSYPQLRITDLKMWAARHRWEYRNKIRA